VQATVPELGMTSSQRSTGKDTRAAAASEVMPQTGRPRCRMQMYKTVCASRTTCRCDQQYVQTSHLRYSFNDWLAKCPLHCCCAYQRSRLHSCHDGCQPLHCVIATAVPTAAAAVTAAVTLYKPNGCCCCNATRQIARALSKLCFFWCEHLPCI
jgi:hypothetical protein